MGLLNGMKDKLGFGTNPEWTDDYADDGYYDEQAPYDAQGGYDGGYADEGYDQGGYADEGYDGGYADGAHDSGRVVSFDAYNPDNFENVKVSTDRDLRVASYDDLGSTPLSSPRSSRGSYASRIGTSSSRSAGSSAGAANWAAPEDPSFLNNTGGSSYSRDIYDNTSSRSDGADAYSSLGSDLMRFNNDPAKHLAIVKPTAYADVEQIANAVKAGKSVALVFSGTKPALAKRILDFTFGAASALNLNVDKAAERVFIISKGTEMLSSAEREYLSKKGIL